MARVLRQNMAFLKCNDCQETNTEMAESAYKGLIVTPHVLEAVLVQNSNGKWFRFALWEDRVFIMDRRQEFPNAEDWIDSWKDTEEEIEELRGYYIKAYGTAPPSRSNHKTLAKAIWVKWFYSAEDRTGDYSQVGKKNHSTGKRERKRNLDGRRYKVLESESTVHLQDQALVVHRELLKFQKASGRGEVAESEVRTIMESAAKSGILKTKQDPFRIFQYYRGALQKAGKLETL